MVLVTNWCGRPDACRRLASHNDSIRQSTTSASSRRFSIFGVEIQNASAGARESATLAGVTFGECRLLCWLDHRQGRAPVPRRCRYFSIMQATCQSEGPGVSNSQYGHSTETHPLVTLTGVGYCQVLGPNQFDLGRSSGNARARSASKTASSWQ